MREEFDGKLESLRKVLQQWETPTPSRGLDEAVMAAFRDAATRHTFWQRIFLKKVSLPAPLAVGVWLLCILLGAMLRPLPETRVPQSPEPVREKPAGQTPRQPAVAATAFETGTVLIPSSSEVGYVTQLDLRGFQVIHDGPIVITARGDAQ